MTRARELLAAAGDHERAYATEGSDFDRDRALALADEALSLLQALELRVSYRQGLQVVHGLRLEAEAVRDRVRRDG